ncbi:MAG: hypothetical protein V9E89_13400 [Ilumatobacteraceae bacterium]|jgi:hypothetical protein
MERFQGSPDDVHEWLSFEDPGEHRTWMVDATFLRSAWTCIFGDGCQGVLDGDATHLQQGCCSHGAHFIDDADVQTVVGAVERLRRRHWQFHQHGRNRGVLDTDEHGATVTRLVDDACIFLNRPGFPGGAGCALHVGALDAGERPMDWKPDVCWQLPLRLEHHTDDSGHVTSTLREWKRRDWGGGGEAFHWWCTDAPEAFVGRASVYTYLRDEIIELVGADAYARIGELLVQAVPLPHPAVRR